MFAPNASLFQHILFYVFLAFFLAASIAHLIASFQEKPKMRRLTKPYCLLFLGAAMAAILPEQPLIYIGAWFGCLGDILLIKKGKVHLMLGLSAFLAGHICYITHTLLFLSAQNVLKSWVLFLLIGIGVVFSLALVLPLRNLVTKSWGLAIGGSVYFSVLSVVFLSTLLATTLGFGKFYALATIGSVLFIGSDLLLAITIFRHEIKRKDFFIMLSYLFAEAFILFGFLLTSVL